MPTTEAARPDLHDQVVALLEQLGDTRDKVADTLALLGVTGKPDDAAHCPIANYLNDRLGVSVAVGGDEITFGADQYLDIEFTPVAEFISDFDQGYYSELAAPLAVTR